MKSRVFLIAALSVCAALVFAQGGGGAGGGQGRRGGLGQGFGRGGGFGQSELQLALRADVQKDLGVTAEQKTKLEALRPARGERGAGGGAGGVGGGTGGAGGGAGGAGGGQGRRGGGAAGAGNFDPAAMQARMEEQRAAQHKALAEILNADQMKRLGEIAVQLRGNRAILDPAVQKALNFTDAQKKQVADLMQKQQEANRSIREKVQNQEISREEMQAAMEKNNKVLDEEFGKVLTAEQAAKLKEMHGKPFKADLQPAGRGGGGGR